MAAFQKIICKRLDGIDEIRWAIIESDEDFNAIIYFSLNEVYALVGISLNGYRIYQQIEP